MFVFPLKIIVGSSMGGWLMLATALERPHRIHALVGIATSADFPQKGVEQYPKEVGYTLDLYLYRLSGRLLYDWCHVKIMYRDK